MKETRRTESTENFTDLILPVFYVKDTLASLSFYRELCGFILISFYDSALGREVKVWQKPEPPTFIRMAAANQEFGLHLNRGEFSAIGGSPHYFEVNDVESKHQELIAWGGTPTNIIDLP